MCIHINIHMYIFIYICRGPVIQNWAQSGDESSGLRPKRSLYFFCKPRMPNIVGPNDIKWAGCGIFAF